jgi:hypothetical protein
MGLSFRLRSYKAFAASQNLTLWRVFMSLPQENIDKMTPVEDG